MQENMQASEQVIQEMGEMTINLSFETNLTCWNDDFLETMGADYFPSRQKNCILKEPEGIRKKGEVREEKRKIFLVLIFNITFNIITFNIIFILARVLNKTSTDVTEDSNTNKSIPSLQ